MNQYYILTLDPRAREVFTWLFQHKDLIDLDIHLNRTRFTVPEGSLLTEFLLRFADCCPRVDPSIL
jgi:hypothetical protein